MKYFFTVFFIIFFYTSFGQKIRNHRDSIDVIDYHINLQISPSKHQIKGNTIVKLFSKFDNTSIIKLDLLKLTVTDIQINEKTFKNWSYNDSIITIKLKKPLKTDDTISINVFYNGHPIKDKTWGGFYFSDNTAYNMGVGMTAIPHSFGRVWFPCNDIFTDKAIYYLNFTVPHTYNVSSGGILTQHKIDELDTYSYFINHPIPTYLVSVAVGKYETINKVYKGIKRDIAIEIFTPKNKKEKVEKSLINLTKVLRIYENLFGEYRWNVVRYTLVPFRSGAMEHVENISIALTAFDGTLKHENLIYHELSHSWFGNLVTCKTAGDMWLNEGWASYCEALVMENLYGIDRFKDYNRLRHLQVIYFAHKDDNGYRALANMDLNYTYGTTVYKRGADVIHTLRFYIGDSLFFATTKDYLNHFKFSNASTKDFEKFYSKKTKIDLKDFFNFWVYSKSRPFYEITNWKTDKDNNVTITVKQRVIGDTILAKSNKIEIFFIDSNLNIEKQIFEFSGKQATKVFKCGFQPSLVCLDLDEHIADLTIDKYHIIKDTGYYTFDESFFDAKIEQINGKGFIRAIANCLEPDHELNKKYLFQKNYYWTIEGIWHKNFKAKGRFYFTKLMDINFTKKYKKEDIIILYRKKTGEKWIEIPFDRQKDFLETDLHQGQYCFAIKQ